MKPNQEHLIAAAMLRDFQQVLHAVEPRFSREIVGDVFEGDRLNRIHHDVPVVHWVTAANLHMRSLPDPNGASDSAAPNLFTKMFGEHHGWTCCLRFQSIDRRRRDRVSSSAGFCSIACMR